MEPISEEAEDSPQDAAVEQERAPDLLRLKVTEGPAAGQVFDKLARFEVVASVGRTKASTVHIKDPGVSERHGALSWSQEGWLLRDLGSSNGTSVNGKALESEGLGILLKDGDEVLFGTDSKVHVEITAHADPNITVEQYFEAECHRLIQRVRGRYEQAANQLQKEWRAHRAQLLEEAGIQT